MPIHPAALERRHVLRLAGLATLASATAACSEPDSSSTSSSPPAASIGRNLLANYQVHELDIAMTAEQFGAALAAYETSGAKEWVECAVRADGTAYERCGVRLKGNSTLWRVNDTAGATAADYPWLVRFDKYVDGQAHGGITEVSVRANNTASALNEALSLDLLARTGLAAQGWAYAQVTVAGSAPSLRLLVENPSDAWMLANFGTQGMLYKAQATANYDYLGDDPARYADRFEQEAGEDDLAPLIAFLQWVNQSSVDEFSSGLTKHLDADAFATYLAFEDLIDNYDAIDGPGNNSYLFHDPAKARMTVVAWDHNLTFGVTNRPGGQGGRGPMGQPGGGAGGGAPGRRGNQTGNVLSRRFETTPDYAFQITSDSARLRSELIAGGYAAGRLDALVTLIASSGQIDAATLAREKASIAAYLTA